MSFGLCVFSLSWQSQEVITCVLRSLSHLNLASLESVLENLIDEDPYTMLAAAHCNPNLF